MGIASKKTKLKKKCADQNLDEPLDSEELPLFDKYQSYQDSNASSSTSSDDSSSSSSDFSSSSLSNASSCMSSEHSSLSDNSNEDDCRAKPTTSQQTENEKDLSASADASNLRVENDHFLKASNDENKLFSPTVGDGNNRDKEVQEKPCDSTEKIEILPETDVDVKMKNINESSESDDEYLDFD